MKVAEKLNRFKIQVRAKNEQSKSSPIKTPEVSHSSPALTIDTNKKVTTAQINLDKLQKKGRKRKNEVTQLTQKNKLQKSKLESLAKIPRKASESSKSSNKQVSAEEDIIFKTL